MSFLDRLLGYNELSSYGIALDVGTEYIKTLIYQVHNGRAHIKGVGRVHQALKDMQGGAISDIAGVIKNCTAAIEAACAMAHIAPDRVIMGIAGELVKGTTITVQYVRKNAERKIDEKELREMMRRVQEQAYARAKSQIDLESGKPHLDIKLVNAAVVDVTIDGHMVTNPIGFTGRVIDISIYNAFAPMMYLGALESVADHLGLQVMGIAAEPYAVARSISQDRAHDFSAICIDIGGGTTDIAVIRAGGLEGTSIFSIGGRAFTKRIAREFAIPFEKAEELKLAYSNQELDERRRSRIAAIMREDVKVWLKGVALVLQDFSGRDLLPRKILLCGGGSLLPEVRAALEGDDWAKGLALGGTPMVEFMHPNDIKTIIDETKTLKSPSDITAMALANLSIEAIDGGSADVFGNAFKKMADEMMKQS